MNTLLTLGQASRETKLENFRHRIDPEGSTIVAWVVAEQAPEFFYCRAVWNFGEEPLIPGILVMQTTAPSICDVVDTN